MSSFLEAHLVRLDAVLSTKYILNNSSYVSRRLRWNAMDFDQLALLLNFATFRETAVHKYPSWPAASLCYGRELHFYIVEINLSLK